MGSALTNKASDHNVSAVTTPFTTNPNTYSNSQFGPTASAFGSANRKPPTASTAIAAGHRGSLRANSFAIRLRYASQTRVRRPVDEEVTPKVPLEATVYSLGSPRARIAHPTLCVQSQ